MEILPTTASDFAGETTALRLNVALLKKAQDIAASQIQAILPQPARSASSSGQGTRIDVSA